MKLDRCPSCEGTRSTPLARWAGLRLVRCEECTLVYTDPQPREEVRHEYLAGADLADHFAPLAARKRIIYDRQLKALPAPRPGHDRLCDVGCADGQFLAIAAERGWSIHGIELNPPAAARARKRGAMVFEGAFEELDDLPWGSFDLVTAWNVLEHTPEPRAFSARLMRLLGEEGTLGLSTLNWDSLVRRTFGERWSMVVPEHFTYWSVASLTGLLEVLGGTTVASGTYGVGRDFFALLDRVAALRSRARRAPAGQAPAQPRASRWDTAGAVVRLERLANRALAARDDGVAIWVTARQ